MARTDTSLDYYLPFILKRMQLAQQGVEAPPVARRSWRKLGFAATSVAVAAAWAALHHWSV